MLREAFNMLTRLHSRPAYLKRLGSPTLYSPIRITPSNYFRFLEGPSSIVIRGREFVIPVDSIKGSETQLISFSTVPTSGGFTLTYGAETTAVISYDDLAADVQTALRALTGLESVTVTGNFSSGFVVAFIGVQSPSLLVYALDASPLNATISIAEYDGEQWETVIKRGDKIVDSLGHLAIDEIIEMVDIGGSVMGYRVRTE